MKTRIRSKHPSHRALRGLLHMPFRALVNFGKTNPSCLPRGRYVLVNPPESVTNAADKLQTKRLFDTAGVTTAPWWPDWNPDRFPVVVKHRHGSRGTGVYLMKTPEELAAFFAARGEAYVKEHFIVERFKNYRFEYRIHATQTEAFSANRKARRDGVPEDQRWKHTFNNSVWFNEANPEFRKPTTWEDIKAEAIKAVTALSLDFGAVDIKVNNRGEFFIIEVNSAPSLGGATRDSYLELLPRLAQQIKETRGVFTK